MWRGRGRGVFISHHRKLLFKDYFVSLIHSSHFMIGFPDLVSIKDFIIIFLFFADLYIFAFKSCHPGIYSEENCWFIIALLWIMFSLSFYYSRRIIIIIMPVHSLLILFRYCIYNFYSFAFLILSAIIHLCALISYQIYFLQLKRLCTFM